MIIFKTLTIEGFASIREQVTLSFKNKGLTVIKGVNGYGKTTIFSALLWCLYDQPLKKKSSILTWEHKRDKDYRGCIVSTQFSKGKHQYRVIRCKEYRGKVDGVIGKNRVFIYRDGEPLDDKKVKDSKKTLIEILGMGVDLFLASVVFGQKMRRLIEEDGPKKKAVLDEAFNILYINRALELAKEERIKLALELTQFKNKLSSGQLLVDSHKEELNNLSLIVSNFEKDREIKIQGLINQEKEAEIELSVLREVTRDEIKEFDAKLEEIKNQKKDNVDKRKPLEHIPQKVGKEKARRDTIKGGIEKLEKTIADLPKTTLCSKCGQEINKGIKATLLREATIDLNDLNISLKAVNKALLGYKKELASLVSMQNKYAILDAKYYKKLEEKGLKEEGYRVYAEAKEKLKGIREEIKTVGEEKPPQVGDRIGVLKETIFTLETDNQELEAWVKKLSRKLKVYDWLVTTPLSNSGIKIFIFNQMLQKVNLLLKKYTPYIGFTPQFEVDIHTARKDVNMVIYQGRYPIAYEDLSGGQSQLVNVVVAFAIHELVSHDNINLLVLDEVFESLSENNIELVSSIIEDKAKDKSVYLITHLSDFVSQNSEILEISYDNTTTRLG